jgi:hypothetical protein
VMADVTRMPENAFGYVPTPALVAPIEFTMRREDYQALGGHMDHVMPIADAYQGKIGAQNDHILGGRRSVATRAENPRPTDSRHFSWNPKDGRG